MTIKIMQHSTYTNVSLFVFLADIDMPDHNLEPPRFCRHALESILQEWQAVSAMILNGCQDKKK